MRLRAAVVAAVAPGFVAAFACTAVKSEFSCTSDDQCKNGATVGRCENTGFCSFPDSSCGVGWRYGPNAGDHTGQCPTFCDRSTATFCADFDKGPPVDQGWDRLDDAGGTAVLDNALSTTPPNSARVEVPANANGKVFFAKAFALSGATRIQVDFDYRPSSLVSANFAQLVFVDTSDAVYQLILQLEAMPDPPQLIELSADAGVAHLFDAGFVVGRWTHVSLHVDLARNAVDVSLDCQDAGSCQEALVDASITPTVTPSQVSLNVGPKKSVATESDVLFWFDTITFDLAP